MLESMRAQPLLSNTGSLYNGLFLPPCLHTRLQTLAASVPPWAASSLTRRIARKRRQTSSRTSTKTSWWNSSRKQETWRRWREPGASSRCTRILRTSPKHSWLFSRTRRTNLCSLPDWRASRWRFDKGSFRWEAVQMSAQRKKPITYAGARCSSRLCAELVMVALQSHAGVLWKYRERRMNWSGARKLSSKTPEHWCFLTPRRTFEIWTDATGEICLWRGVSAVSDCHVTVCLEFFFIIIIIKLFWFDIMFLFLSVFSLPVTQWVNTVR